MSIRRRVCRFGLSMIVAIILLASCTPGSPAPTPTPTPVATQSVVSARTVLSADDLLNGFTAPEPVDNAHLALPEGAAAPAHTFEGRLELLGEAAGGSVNWLDSAEELPATLSHLPEFDFAFVQSGTYLVPVRRGLIVTEHPTWNYLLEPGRVWREEGDQGWSRASFPFGLTARGGSSTYHGVMTFLYNDESVSRVYYQITQETGVFLRGNLWGLLEARYHPGEVQGGAEVRSAFEQELGGHIPTRPIEQLAVDYPGVNVSALTRHLTPEHLTTYGLVVDGVHYRGGCNTRYGPYPYCEWVRMPSLSTAKTAFVAVALMRLTQMVGPEVADLLIRDYVPETADSPGDWRQVTFDNTLDMATGNYVSPAFMVDEEGRIFSEFFGVTTHEGRIRAALDWPNRAPPGTRWVYRSSDTFILVVALQNYLRTIEGPDADLFDFVVREVYAPIGIGPGFFSTTRTSDDNWQGTPVGAAGLWWIPDDVARVGIFLNNQRGALDGEQLLDPGLLAAGLQADPEDRGLPIPGGTYNNAFWSQHFSAADGYDCDFDVPYMAGYCGIIIALLPNGVTYYYFSDNREFNWYAAVREIDRIAPLCDTQP